jgi:AraC-like DNA-binding protein
MAMEPAMPDPAEPRIAPLPRNLLDALVAGGFDPARLARQAGLDPALLEGGLTFPEADRFFCAAWNAAGDPTVGLTAGSMIRPERFGIVGIAAMSCPTYEAAIERKARYWRLIWGDPYHLVRRGDEVAAVLMPAGPERPYTQAKIDMELASLLAFGRLFTGAAITPRRLTMCQPAPAWRRRYEEVFGCPVLFSQPENSLVLALEDVRRPLISRNAEVAQLTASGAEAALDRLPSDGVRLRAARAIEKLLQGEEPTLALVASELCMSERSLQRKLAAEGLRFTDLLDECRGEAAKRHLAQGPATADEVAFLLGFATPSSFFRAFKRWTGQTPEGWRRQARGVAA